MKNNQDASNRGGKREGAGRKKGVPNKTTALLKEAILGAAEKQGFDGAGKDGLTGYCQYLAKDEPKAFAQLLGKVIPLQVTGEDGQPIKHDVRFIIVSGHQSS